MDYFLNRDGIRIIREIISSIQSNKVYLSTIDGKIGDGDHGINMNKGFTMASQRIGDSCTLSAGFGEIANVLMTEIGGSMGPIYGTFFETLSEKSRQFEQITSDRFAMMLSSATDAVMELCEAQPGDKTLIDTLVPAVNCYKIALEKGATFGMALGEMVKGARKGLDSTLDMVSKKGRSSRLGERSRGVIDAGAASCYIILEALANSIPGLLRVS